MEQTVGVVLAGGRSRRMAGTEKIFLPFLNGLLLTRILERFVPQVASVWLSANGDPVRLARFGVPVIGDVRPDQPGPLAGVEAAFLATGADWIVTVPVDAPFLPTDLLRRLNTEKNKEDQPVVAASAGRIHPVVCLWPRGVLSSLSAALESGNRRLLDWFAGHPHRVIEFASRVGEPDPFFNVNDPDSLFLAQRWASTGMVGRETT
ncbi:MAG: molybdenum cofactor guanylyltransferase [Magnetococcales bacterium]|nr:molybdenum cofactor guanylyltransferase [Magnetococcales bacterium]